MPETTRLSRDGHEVEVRVGDVVPLRNGASATIIAIDGRPAWPLIGDAPGHGFNLSWTPEGYFWSASEPRQCDIDIAALVAQQAARQRSGVEGLVEKWRARAALHSKESGFFAHGQSSAFFDCATELEQALAALDQEARDG